MQIETTLKGFEAMVHKDFTGPGLYPTHVLTIILKLTVMSMNPFPTLVSNTSMSLILLFGPWLHKAAMVAAGDAAAAATSAAGVVGCM